MMITGFRGIPIFIFITHNLQIELSCELPTRPKQHYKSGPGLVIFSELYKCE